jgi:hypothetical protein
MLKFQDYVKESCNCWLGYKRKPGTKPCAKGSCVKEENNIGYEGTDKLTKYRKKMTPGEKPVTPCMLPEFEDLEKNK